MRRYITPFMPLPDNITNIFDEVSYVSNFMELFNHIPDVYVFCKDRDSRFVWVNHALIKKLGKNDVSEVIGTKDGDYFPEELCESFRPDDLQVFSDSAALIDRVELGLVSNFELRWFITSKLPMTNTQGDIVGLLGVTRVFNESVTDGKEPGELDPLIKWLADNHNRRVTTSEMAKQLDVSLKTLRKRFQKVFGTTPQDYELTARITAASHKMVETDWPISEIALEFGFCDQSAFANQFKKRIGLTPNEFRQRKN